MSPTPSLSVFTAAAGGPDRPAVLADGETLSWRDLARLARRALTGLRSRGLAPDDPRPVALVAHNDLPTFATLHACIAAGHTVHLLQPRWTAAERDAVVDAIGPALRVDAAADGMVDPAAEPASAADPGVERGEAAVVAPPAHALDDEAILAVVYTSGSTGRPKGVRLSRRAFLASARSSAANLGWRVDDRWLLRLPLAHVGGLSILTRSLLARTAVVLPSPDDDRAADLARRIERDRVTLLSLVPTLLRRLLELEPPWDPPRHLRAILLGGAPATAELLTRAADRGWPVLTTYGMSETCSQVATQRPGTRNRGELGAGPPLPGVELRIADDGGIEVRGDMLFSGYHGGPAGGASRGGRSADGWFRTGDRGRLDDAGNLHVRGRADAVIISGGENVDPLEVEAALRAVPGVADACVFGLPDPEWGERVCAAVVPAAGLAVGDAPDAALARVLAAVAEAAARSLAGPKRPRSLAVLDRLPLTPSGKLDRPEVRRRAESRLRPL